MERRSLLIGGVATLAVPATLGAQPASIARVGLVFTTSPVASMMGVDPSNPIARAFVRAMRSLGWIEGQNLILERRSAEGDSSRYPTIFEELVRLKCDVIVTFGTSNALEARRVTSTTPIVMMGITDPVGSGLVASLAKPGGNITGITVDSGPELEPKRLELFLEAVPKARRLGVVENKGVTREFEWRRMRDTAARQRGITLIYAETTPRDVSQATALFSRSRVDGIITGKVVHLFPLRRTIVDFAVANRIPLMGENRYWTEEGGLISYAVVGEKYWGHAAVYVDKILKGAKPGDLPIEEPRQLELVINLKTAKALGLTIPPALLARADQVIE